MHRNNLFQRVAVQGMFPYWLFLKGVQVSVLGQGPPGSKPEACLLEHSVFSCGI